MTDGRSPVAPPTPSSLDLPERGSSDALVEPEELPVVARLVVEIRSDGRRTVARGAMESVDGQRVAVQAESTTPWALAKQLAGALWKLPQRRGGALRALLPGSRRRRDE
ncbi:hypothetical protein [Paraliomyxa miuraensis]|uniref:hypothetical protein n=1 Tax=Paraliomyxa miuraensis TaxID=376150 RepID=UPI0022503623|nr:hypothetical protein [Paraliomyxa miuraensis]MCX4243236.1 hypothetical protein [Paraliomyxa miuraensis]